jgi:hypothetical protein
MGAYATATGKNISKMSKRFEQKINAYIIANQGAT